MAGNTGQYLFDSDGDLGKAEFPLKKGLHSHFVGCVEDRRCGPADR